MSESQTCANYLGNHDLGWVENGPYGRKKLKNTFLAFKFSGDYISVNQGIALLFSFIAVITLPHMIMMDLLYLRIEGKTYLQ